jgi:hypothetical protein
VSVSDFNPFEAFYARCSYIKPIGMAHLSDAIQQPLQVLSAVPLSPCAFPMHSYNTASVSVTAPEHLMYLSVH